MEYNRHWEAGQGSGLNQATDGANPYGSEYYPPPPPPPGVATYPPPPPVYPPPHTPPPPPYLPTPEHQRPPIYPPQPQPYPQPHPPPPQYPPFYIPPYQQQQYEAYQAPYYAPFYQNQHQYPYPPPPGPRRNIQNEIPFVPQQTTPPVGYPPVYPQAYRQAPGNRQGHGFWYSTLKKDKISEFQGRTNADEAEDWIRSFERACENHDIPEYAWARLGSALMAKSAEDWIKSVELRQGKIAEWAVFKELFYKEYFPQSVQAAKASEFLNLRMGSRSVDQFLQRFNELGRFYPEIMRNEEKKKLQFYNALPRELIHGFGGSGAGTSFDSLIERARVVERYLAKPSVLVGTKRPFSGNTSSGKPTQRPFMQSSRATGANAVVPSGACTKCKKVHSGDCKPVVCYNCNETGHYASVCPSRSRAAPSNQRQQNNPRPTRMYAIDIESTLADDSVLTGTVIIGKRKVSALFDTGASGSFISKKLVKELGLFPKELSEDMILTTPLGEVTKKIESVPRVEIQVGDFRSVFSLMVLDLAGFDVILGVDWLSRSFAHIDCVQRRLTFTRPGKPDTVFQADQPKEKKEYPKIISAIKAAKALSKGCAGFMVFVVSKEKVKASLEETSIVSEYPEVFPDELPGDMPDREIEFEINLMPGAAPAAKAPYRMAPAELKELKEQLAEMLERGVIRPSTSPWGAPVLFVKKKIRNRKGVFR